MLGIVLGVGTQRRAKTGLNLPLKELPVQWESPTFTGSSDRRHNGL